ncbi:MAG TPA: alpha-amylase family glycosyl hydrolase [Chitinophagaceae bacterium]|nr:alpha-amylase family glycosyl hydrolase [Chitinophagaceae bacterium]
MRKHLKRFVCLIVVMAFYFSAKTQAPPKGEIIYHLFQRSFYDSNGDNQGDLNGIRQKLDYLQDLGITSILLLPLYESVYYHNYFAVDFGKIDPEFGTMQDFIALVKEIHRRGMKIYIDMETQYVTEDQLWWKDSYGNPGSKYSNYILYNDSAHTKPESIIFGLTELPGYDGTKRKVGTANLYDKDLQEYNFNLFKYFVDPDNNGKFDDGVDGFRLDHMMDDLDFKGRLKDLFAKFWTPLLTRLRQVNPKLSIVAEQAIWFSYGNEYFEKGNVDRVFAFQLQAAIASFDKNRIASVADTTLNMIPKNKQQVVFIENHDMQRFATGVNKDISKEKIGAALNLLIGGVPAIYYGQELGMFGRNANGKYGMTDANDIPMREAFEWYKNEDGKGMAIWYKNTGPWWDNTNLKANDGISLEEEKNDPESLYNFYKKMIHFRQSHPELIEGSYQALSNNNDKVFTFLRKEKTAICIAVNLSDKVQQTAIDISSLKARSLEPLWGNEKGKVSGNSLLVSLPAYGVGIWQIQ